MESTNQQPHRSFSKCLNNISKPAMIEAISSIGRMYAGFQSASFQVMYQDSYECLMVFAHFNAGRVYSGSVFTQPGVTLLETIAGALVMLNDKILRAYNEPQEDLSNPIETALECREVQDHEGQIITEAFLSQNETSDLRTEYAA